MEELSNLETENESNFGLIKRIENDFLSKYESSGFKIERHNSLLVEEDESLLFANSTMCRYKKAIEDGNVPQTGIAIQQKCLRSHGLNNYFDESFDFDFNSYFSMVGILIPEQETSNVSLVESTLSFLESQGINRDKLFMKSSAVINKANAALIKLDQNKIVLDTEPPNYYKWIYGNDRIEGEGATICIRKDDGTYADLGNIICISEKHTGNVLAWESGFGIETLIAQKNGENLFKPHAIWDVIPYSTDPGIRKIADSIVAIIELIHENVAPGPKKQNYVLRKYLQVIFKYAPYHKDINLKKVVEAYCGLKGYGDVENIFQKIDDYMLHIQASKTKNLNSFSKFVKHNPDLSKIELAKIARSSFSLLPEEIVHLVD